MGEIIEKAVAEGYISVTDTNHEIERKLTSAELSAIPLSHLEGYVILVGGECFLRVYQLEEGVRFDYQGYSDNLTHPKTITTSQFLERVHEFIMERKGRGDWDKHQFRHLWS